MNVLADPHATKAVAALDADAPVPRFMDEIADGEVDFALLEVDAHRSMVSGVRRPCRRYSCLRGPTAAAWPPHSTLKFLHDLANQVRLVLPRFAILRERERG